MQLQVDSIEQVPVGEDAEFVLVDDFVDDPVHVVVVQLKVVHLPVERGDSYSLKSFFCSTALTSVGWVRMTIKPRHCPPTKQCGRH